MRRQIHTTSIIALMASILVLSGCVSRGTHPPTPYLGSLAGMADSQREGKFEQEFVSDDVSQRVALRQYKKVQIQDLRFEHLEEADKHKKDILTKLNKSYREAFESTLRDAGLTIVPAGSSADSSTLVIESALVKIYSPNRALNVLTTFLIGPITNGGGAFESQLVDGGSRQPIAKIAEEQKGAWHLGSILIGGYMKYYDTEKVFVAWAKRLRELLTGEE